MPSWASWSCRRPRGRQTRTGRWHSITTKKWSWPKGDLPDIFLEVCTRTDLVDRFTHVNERGARVADFQISLAAVLVAQSGNIGFEPMIRSDIPALRRDRLSSGCLREGADSYVNAATPDSTPRVRALEPRSGEKIIAT